MKHSFILYCAFALMLTFSTTSTVCGQAGIKVIARLLVDEGSAGNSRIAVLKDGKLFRSFKGSQKVDLLLLRDKEYEFVFSKKGYIEKRVVFSTRDIPLSRWQKGFFTFPFEVTLEKSDEDNPGERYRFPVAISEYDLVFDDFITRTDYSRTAAQAQELRPGESAPQGLIRDIVLRPVAVVNNGGFLNKYADPAALQPTAGGVTQPERYKELFVDLAEGLRAVLQAKEMSDEERYYHLLNKLSEMVVASKTDLEASSRAKIIHSLEDNLGLMGSKEDNYVVMSVFTAALYGSSNQPTYGYINYGDGAGIKELAQNEFNLCRQKYFGNRVLKEF